MQETAPQKPTRKQIGAGRPRNRVVGQPLRVDTVRAIKIEADRPIKIEADRALKVENVGYVPSKNPGE